MASSSEKGTPRPDEKVLHVWSKPIEQGDHVPGQNPDGTTNQSRPQFSDAISRIKKEDFLNVASTPCARQGLLTGIATGAGLGGLKFVVHSNLGRATNWAVGFFVLGSVASYEYCQYQRRAERIQMKRNIEIVTEKRKEQAMHLAEERRMQQQAEEERRTKERSWYKFW